MLNGTIAALLRDYAEVQDSPQRRWGYKRAAQAVRSLAEPIETLLLADGTLRKIRHVGPASSRIILEVLHDGRSCIVDDAIAASKHTARIDEQRRLREHFLTRAEALSVLRTTAGASALTDNYQGDLQMHSTWSDGHQSLEDIIVTRRGRGYRYSAVTDHSYGLPIARGLSMARIGEQHREIERLNISTGETFRLLKGIEANIRGDGRIDMTDDELRLFEIVVAAPHSALRTTGDQTARLVAAVMSPGVHILGHPRGRMYGSRAGLQVNWREVFAAAAQRRVAIEIDGDPSRQDLDYVLARQALSAGCVLAVDTDAHSVRDIDYVDTALAHAALAGATPRQVINCWPLEQLLAWSAARSSA